MFRGFPIFVFLIAIASAFVARIDNYLIGHKPILECGHDAITVRIQTSDLFVGRIYVKGHSKEPGCFLKASGQTTSEFLQIPFGKCASTRRRTPDGIAVSTTVIISFHPYFETESDGAFRLECHYKGQLQAVKQTLEALSMKTAKPVEPPLPKCKYEILEGGPNGRPLRLASVGSLVYHKWQCTTSMPDKFCVQVHSCLAEDPSEKAVEILNNHGCAMDTILLNNLDYLDDLTAGQYAHVYKFADQNSIYFQCQILISRKKANGTCPRPRCPKPTMGHFMPNDDFHELNVSFDGRDKGRLARSVNVNVSREINIQDNIMWSWLFTVYLSMILLCGYLLIKLLHRYFIA